MTATAAGSGATPSHPYAAAGTYTVTLTVTDNDGATDTETAPVTVTRSAGQPAADGGVHPHGVDLTTSVNGSGSTDPDGTIASYSWNWGDATANGSGVTASHTYAAAGTYTVTLTVTDNDGATDTKTARSRSRLPGRPGLRQGRLRAHHGQRLGHRRPRRCLDGVRHGQSLVGGQRRRERQPPGRQQWHLEPGGASPRPTPRSRRSLSTSKVATGSGQYLSVIARQISPNNDYRGKLQVRSDGTVAVVLTKMVAGTETTLSSTVVLPGVTVAANDKLRVRTQAVGTSPTTLRVKVWKDGTTEPATWTLTATDSTSALQVAGSVGFYFYLSSGATNGPTLFTVDDLWVGPSRP